jgi:hypothetical protein
LAATGADVECGAVAFDGDAREAAAGVVGSGFMMLTAGVDAAVGKSALVGRPVGIDEGSVASAPAAAGNAGGVGAFQDGA